MFHCVAGRVALDVSKNRSTLILDKVQEQRNAYSSNGTQLTTDCLMFKSLILPPKRSYELLWWGYLVSFRGMLRGGIHIGRIVFQFTFYYNYLRTDLKQSSPEDGLLKMTSRKR